MNYILFSPVVLFIFVLCSCQDSDNNVPEDNAALGKERTHSKEALLPEASPEDSQISNETPEPNVSPVDSISLPDVILPELKTSENETTEKIITKKYDGEEVEMVTEPKIEESIAPSNPPEVTPPANFQEYNRLDAFLRANVSSSGKVNYAQIKKNSSQLEAIIKEFEEHSDHSGWSIVQKLTYWINAYNIYTIQLITDHYPINSITKITAKPWDKPFIRLGGKLLTLNQIENEIIRPKFNEPRIHFVLNCASESCPILLNRAYTPQKLYGQMTSQTKRFLDDNSKNQLTGTTLRISKIFDWYGVDFTKNGGTVLSFIQKYATEQIPDDVLIEYSEYSWELNE